MSADLAFDFETLSAYVDDELDEGTRDKVEAALARDPELSYQVDAIRALKSDIAHMGGDGLRNNRGLRNARPLPYGPAIAAALAVMVVSALLAFAWLETARSPNVDVASQMVAAHDGFVANETPNPVVPAHVREAEVFRQAGLRLVVDETMTFAADNTLRHRGYVGPQGCRVSVFSLPVDARETAERLTFRPDFLSAHWVAGADLLVVVARSMDQVRFEAITSSLRRISDPEFAPTIASVKIPRTTCSA
ncbi:anti-sigma factor family protein [Pelagibacterium luteolum]|uniref:Transmembrane transcriptional regulator (Anti-sigma factor RsiW) n=1 Tax=Pelagibacterium luteolum TaxID=440168 RepID=A0A1G7ZP40_9HYPH|nr:zf-HC2 domain-containing protein [Pelagibacterium luteolum]SDH10444.1 hypothetical protein SAMN04487974_12147 [Pelagibacterium luteolum]